ncbi:hypothetical protein Tco_0597025 [Tanacetum coccineum]
MRERSDMIYIMAAYWGSDHGSDYIPGPNGFPIAGLLPGPRGTTIIRTTYSGPEEQEAWHHLSPDLLTLMSGAEDPEEDPEDDDENIRNEDKREGRAPSLADSCLPLPLYPYDARYLSGRSSSIFI